MTHIQIRRDTSTNWTTNNPTLLAGEQGYETDTAKMKIGNGTTAWNDLEYFSTGGGGEPTDSYTKAETNALLDKKQDVLTPGDGVEILLVNPDAIQKDYKYYNSTTSTWDTISNPSSWTTYTDTTAGVARAIESVSLDRNFELIAKLPFVVNSAIGWNFQTDYNNPRVSESNSIEINSITDSTFTISFGFQTSAANQYIQITNQDLFITISNNGYLYIKFTKTDEGNFAYYSANGTDWSLIANTSGERLIGAGVTGTKSIFVGNSNQYDRNQRTFDLTTVQFSYLPSRESVLTIKAKVDNQTIQVNSNGQLTCNLDEIGADLVDKANTDLSNLSTTGQAILDSKADKATTVSGYGITDAVTTSGAQTVSGTKTFSYIVGGMVSIQGGNTLDMRNDTDASTHYAVFRNMDEGVVDSGDSTHTLEVVRLYGAPNASTRAVLRPDGMMAPYYLYKTDGTRLGRVSFSGANLAITSTNNINLMPASGYNAQVNGSNILTEDNFIAYCTANAAAIKTALGL